MNLDAIRSLGGASILIIVLGSLVWGPTIHGGYVHYDTDWLVVDNPILNSGELSALGLVWTDLSLGVRRTLGAEFLPVRDTTVWIDAWLFGDRWWAHHTVNLLWYLAACLVLLRLFRKWIRSPMTATAMTVLFMVHPLHVESVAWLASRKDVVSLFFFFASIWAWEKWEEGERKWLVWSALMMLLACWAKNTAIVLPGVLFVLGLGREPSAIRRRDWWWQWTPYLVVLTVVVWMSLRTGEQVGMFRESWAENPLDLFGLQFALIWRYLSAMVVPIGLSAVYEIPTARGIEAGLGLVCVSTLVLLGTRAQRNRPMVTVGLGWFLVCLAPVSPWMSLQNLQADRYMLLPSAGLLLALGSALPLVQRWKRPVLVLGFVFLAFLSILTNRRAQVWQETELLWRSAVEAQPYRVDAWSALSGTLLDSGEAEEAEEILLEGLVLLPDHPRLLQSLGTLRLQLGEHRWAEAEEDLRACLEADPSRMRAGYNLSLLLLRTNRADEAIGFAETLTSTRPGYENGWVILGRILMRLGRARDANQAFVRAWQINPYEPMTTQRLARSAWRYGDEDAALTWARRTLEIDPSHPRASEMVRELGAE